MEEIKSREIFDKQSEEYQNDKLAWGWQLPLDKYLFKPLVSEKREGLKILDLGCGNAKHFKNVLIDKYSLDFKYTGVDISDKMLGFAKQNVPQGAFTRVDHLNKFDYQKVEYNTVTILGVLQYLTLEETDTLISKLVKNPSLERFLIKNPAFIRRKVSGEFIEGFGYTHSLEKLKSIFQKYGFKIRSIRGYNSGFMMKFLKGSSPFNINLKMAFTRFFSIFGRLSPKAFEPRDFFIYLTKA